MSRSEQPNRKPVRAARLALHLVRRYPAPAAALGLLLTVLVVLLLPAVGSVLLGVGGVAALGFVAFTSGWSLLRFRALVRAAPTALSWAFRLGLAVALLGAGGFPEVFRQNLGTETSASFVLYVSVALFAVVFVGLFVGGMLAAGIGLWSGRAHRNPVLAAQTAIVTWWLGAIVLSLPWFLFDRTVPESVSAAFILAWVPWTAARSARERSFSPDTESFTARAARLFARLRVRAPVGKPGVLDLRGAALGALGAAVSLFLTAGPGTALTPLQHQVLEGLLRFRNEPIISQRGWGPLSADARQSALWRRRIVIAEMDPAARREARTTGSESRVTARVVERLRKWRPLRVAVPVPQLDVSWPASSEAGIDAPPVGAAAVLRNRQDLPLLEAALRASPSALLVLPRFSPPGPKPSPASKENPVPLGFRGLSPEIRGMCERLIRAAHEAADAGVDWYGTHRLPAVRLTDRIPAERPGAEQPFPLPAAAVRLVTAAQGPDSVRFDRRPTVVRIGGQEVPLPAPGLTPVDYGGPEPLQAFPRVSYSSILNGDPVYESEVSGHFGMGAHAVRRPANEYFAGKIVLLTPLDQERVETPAGTLTPTEVLAHATTTLASGQLIRPVPAWLFFLGVLLLGAVVGHACAGATPLAVGWRGGLAVLLPLLLAPIGILLSWWIDPVAPLVATAVSLALVAQTTHNHEQGESRRRRALLERVAAPQVVDELLARPGQLALGGERREVCIIFADVRGFTQFAESHTADEVITVINRYTTAITEVLLARGGILDHYTGDGLVARFELLHSPEADLQRAVEAALGMRDAAEAVAARQERAGAEPLRMGLGVHYGEAVVGLVGSPAQFNYTAMGHTVVVASRLQGLAGGGELLISAEVFGKVGGAFTCEPCEPVWAKGLSEPIRAYRVVASGHPGGSA